MYTHQEFIDLQTTILQLEKERERVRVRLGDAKRLLLRMKAVGIEPPSALKPSPPPFSAPTAKQDAIPAFLRRDYKPDPEPAPTEPLPLYDENGNSNYLNKA